jgi:aminoglycoside 3-N-acetyltransferase
LNPEDVVESLLVALGREGTLLFPALSFGAVTKENPAFDVDATPSCVGYLPEYFRTRSGVLRSVHPTHSCCAAGKRALEITRDHYLDATPVGAHSPFRKLRDWGGKILFIGCGTRPNTSMHGVEELIKPDYLFGDVQEYALRAGDELRSKTYRTHGFSGIQQRYDRLETLLPHGCITYGKLLAADSVLMDARAAWEKALGALKRDDHYFIEKSQ